ncbi:MAG: coproporphyrinogen dehydrogenase HemZ [Syntrophomonadaceae bacterium]|nr:coproporphyrinogen dehydrogenase HemZ [Syntrophomonadaceae bacterium]MDD4548180.1 coproporphyrinogen dehydrogenase HemZ [Syntrophomonadaceae bacterium]
MLVYCDFDPVELYSSIHELVRLAYPGCAITLNPEREAEVKFKIKLGKDHSAVFLQGEVLSSSGNVADCQKYLLSDIYAGENEPKRHARVFAYHLLCQHVGRDINAYGILTGVRPVKLVHKLLDAGYGSRDIKQKLEHEYCLNPKKASLLMEVAENSRTYLLNREEAARNISIYIGIPYCPTRCYYCSFPGAVLNNYEEDIPSFLKALMLEMDVIGTYLNENKITVQSIYVGGGTPTVLSEGDIEIIFNALHKKYISGATAEITVEAGRPDTLSPAKLKLLREAGVTRVCINPQTMNDFTLKLIGRNHDAKGVVQSVEWARKAGIKKINMDLIVGLPGEHLQENTYTVEQILKLCPENITVHTLAMKRGSAMAEMENRAEINDRVEEVQKGVKLFASALSKADYKPYYLYRQKYMKANMENIGYSLEGNFCLYNIQMIEERQTIIGMGGGAASKFINVSDWKLSSFYNPKNPQSYCESVEKLINRKVDKLRALI